MAKDPFARKETNQLKVISAAKSHAIRREEHELVRPRLGKLIHLPYLIEPLAL